MKAGGAKALWLVTAGLALLFLAVWAAGRGEEVIPRQTPRPAVEATPDRNQEQLLVQEATKKARSRVDSRARLAVESKRIQAFQGADLQKTDPGNPDARLGWVIVLVASVDGRPASKLTYHAVPPNQVVFVDQVEP